MAALTWRSVETPSFYTAMEGTRLAAGLLDRAVNNVQSGLTNFDRAQDEVVGNQLALSASRIQDPNQLRTAMSDGTLTAGLDTSRITPAQLLALQTRVGTLQSQNETAYNFDRTQNQNAAMDAAGQAYQDALSTARSGDTAATTRILDVNREIFSRLPLEQQRQLSQAIQTQESNFVRDSQARFGLNRDQQNAADQQTAQTVVNEIQRVAEKAGDVPTLLAKYKGRLTPGAETLINQGLTAVYGNFYGPNAQIGGVGGSAAGAALAGAVNGLTAPPGSNTPGLLVNKGGAAPGAAGFGTAQGSVYDAQYGYGEYGAPDKAPSQMTLGEAEAYGNKLIAATKGKIGAKDAKGNDLGTSALGAYQIVNGTRAAYAKQLFGDNWRNVQFTPEVQDKIGEAIFKDTKGDAAALQKQWTSLTPETAKQVAGLPWEQAKLVIARGESGAVGTNGTTGVSAAGNDVASQMLDRATVNKIAYDAGIGQAGRNTQNKNSGLGADLVKHENSDASPATAAADLIKRSIPGGNPGNVANMIQEIMNITGKNAAQSAAILERSVGSDQRGILSRGAGAVGSVFSNDPADLGGGYRPRADQLRKNMEAALNGGAEKEAVVNNNLAQARAQQTVLQKQFDDAYAALVQTTQRARDNPDLAPLIAQRQLAYVVAQNALLANSRLISAKASNNPTPGPKQVAAAEAQAAEDASLRSRAEAAAADRARGNKLSPNDGVPALVPVATRVAAPQAQGEPLGATGAAIFRQLQNNPWALLTQGPAR